MSKGNRMIPCLLAFVLFLAWSRGTQADDRLDLPFTEPLDPNHLVILSWGFDDVRGTITFRLSINTTGWVGFGLSPNGNMIGADIVIGGTGPDGVYFTDRHALGPFMPVIDKNQSYTLLSMIEEDGRTSMTFQRTIHSCDKFDYPITDTPIKLIYAYGITDTIEYHEKRRGTKSVNLLNHKHRAHVPDGKHFNFTVDNVEIPPNHTYYHCVIKQFPKLNGTHHLYRFEPVIEHVDMVHHMLIYGCPPSVTEASEERCYSSSDRPICFDVVAVWAVGGEAFEMPADSGIKIGSGNDDRFYRLEIHYNNPFGRTGVTDHSGLKIYYTGNLRQHNVGVLTTGIIVDKKYVIPPLANNFHSYGMCNTSDFVEHVDGPVPELQIFAVLLHAHTAGRKIRAGLYRNVTQIDFLGLDENYDFDMQDIATRGNLKTIKPNMSHKDDNTGDEILVECTYDTSSRTQPTTMGLSTKDEMCMAFLFYYPAINITSCWSLPDIKQLKETDIPDFSENQTISQNDIQKYEDSLKHVSQIQAISDVNGRTEIYPQSMIRNMMATPSVSCENISDTKTTTTTTLTTTTTTTSPNNQATRGLNASWFQTSMGILLVLLLRTAWL